MRLCQVADLAESLSPTIAPKGAEKLRYFADNPPKVDWELLFIVIPDLLGLNRKLAVVLFAGLLIAVLVVLDRFTVR